MTGGFGGSVVYAATKGGIVSMTRGMARTYAPTGVRVNTVSPGGVETPMMLGGSHRRGAAPASSAASRSAASPSQTSWPARWSSSPPTTPATSPGATINVSGGFLMY